MQVHTCYRTAKGNEISVYCRVCTKPSSPSYLKKGMLPRLQGTIKLKAVSRLFGRTPRMQGRSAWAERPVCRHISATLLTLQISIVSFKYVQSSFSTPLFLPKTIELLLGLLRYSHNYFSSCPSCNLLTVLQDLSFKDRDLRMCYSLE